jgi:predicted phosphodiesterase
MAAVPGNHGEAVRINGKGVTRYDDSHDTESLIAVKDAADLSPDRFGHVEFFVPDTDELSVVVECSGTVVAHVHGHQFRPGKHFDYWKGQAFNRASAFHQADLLLAGHLHHEHVDTDGFRTFIQPPAMESESTWWRHAKGTTGAPGLIVAVTKDGNTNLKEVVR